MSSVPAFPLLVIFNFLLLIFHLLRHHCESRNLPISTVERATEALGTELEITIGTQKELHNVVLTEQDKYLSCSDIYHRKLVNIYFYVEFYTIVYCM